MDTEGLMHLFSQTALLALDFCYNYKASLETSCAVAFLPKHPGDPEKLDCHLQETNDFHMLIGYLYAFSGKMSIQINYSFFIQVVWFWVGFLMWHYMSSLYILYINPL